MNTPPPTRDLDPGWIASALRSEWLLPPVDLAYRPVGFGSHHWLATAANGQTWFVTVDDLRGRPDRGDRLERAMRTAWLLRHDAGIAEVVAPLATADGKVLATIAEGRWAMALFPCLPLHDPGDGAYLTDDAREDAQRLVARIHAATAFVPDGLPLVEDFAIPHREALRDALDRIDRPWASGPYAEPARKLLWRSLGLVADGFARYDALVGEVRRDTSPWVITHGEPHAANILNREDGSGLAIVDWDTVALAPKERDLWQLLSDAGDPVDDLAAYFVALPPGGDRTVSASAIDVYRLRWDLSEIAAYTEWFANPHDDTEDMRIGWDDLNQCVASLAGQLAAG